MLCKILKDIEWLNDEWYTKYWMMDVIWKKWWMLTTIWGIELWGLCEMWMILDVLNDWMRRKDWTIVMTWLDER